jgi:hypothetical protein
MIRLSARSVFHSAAAVLALATPFAQPLAAQQTFELPPASPSPTPAPAGPADERAGVAIPPRAAPRPTATPSGEPLPAPSASEPPLNLPAPPSTQTPAASAPAPAARAPAPQAAANSAAPTPAATPGLTLDPLAVPTGAPQADAAPGTPAPSASTLDGVTTIPALPDWWPYAAGGLGAFVLLGGGAMVLRRRRKPKPPRLAAPVASAPAAAPLTSKPPRLDLTLEITGATRSVMMFTLQYRLTIANRSGRAVNDINAAGLLVCARASAGQAHPASAAQHLESVARIGPHQARSITGTLQLPLSAVQPLKQGQTPLFVPLVHVTLEGEGLAADTRTFVIGPPSPSGRVHPIPLDQPPGSIAGLVAQAVVLPAASAAA